jgi:adenosylcobinamide kinase / adenosylcobinamide-phosphate guanylyltransferase
MEHTNPLILIIGGARSGKSRQSAALAKKLSISKGIRITYVATALALDEEMQQRVEAHRKARPATWKTVEAPFDLLAAVQKQLRTKDVLLIDCLTFYLANRFMKDFPTCKTTVSRKRLNNKMLTEVKKLAQILSKRKAPAILVTNEVGMSIVPANPMARYYRDLIGFANQIVSGSAQEVQYVVAGITTRIK